MDNRPYGPLINNWNCLSNKFNWMSFNTLSTNKRPLSYIFGKNPLHEN